MTQQTYDDGSQNDQQNGGGENRNIARMREVFEKDYPAAQTKITTLERQLAIRDAGVTPDQIAADPKLAFFIENYQGDATVDAFKAEATKYGFIAPPPPDPAVQQAQDGQQAVVAASTGTAPSNDGSDLNAGLQKAYVDGAAQGRGMEAMQEFARQHNIPIASR